MSPNHGCLVRTLPYGINKWYIPTVIHTLAHQPRRHDWLVWYVREMSHYPILSQEPTSEDTERHNIMRINKQCQNIVVIQMWLVFKYGSMTEKKTNKQKTNQQTNKKKKTGSRLVGRWRRLQKPSMGTCGQLAQLSERSCFRSCRHNAAIPYQVKRFKLENNLAPLHITACQLIIYNNIIAISLVLTTFW